MAVLSFSKARLIGAERAARSLCLASLSLALVGWPGLAGSEGQAGPGVSVHGSLAEPVRTAPAGGGRELPASRD